MNDEGELMEGDSEEAKAKRMVLDSDDVDRLLFSDPPQESGGPELS